MVGVIGSLIFAFVESFLLLNMISVYLIAQAGALAHCNENSLAQKAN